MILKFCLLGTTYTCSSCLNISLHGNLPLIFELGKKQHNKNHTKARNSFTAGYTVPRRLTQVTVEPKDKSKTEGETSIII